jgi:hypothetical protein
LDLSAPRATERAGKYEYRDIDTACPLAKATGHKSFNDLAAAMFQLWLY